MVRYLVLCLSVALVLVGCRSAQLGNDQADMRQTLLRLYEEQVLDNLIRAKKRYPIVQVDYSNMTGTMNQVASATLRSNVTRTSNTPHTGFVNTLLRALTYFVELSGTASETANLTITGQPVIAVDSVYDEYLDALVRHPDLIKEASGPLAASAYHRKREFEGATWYVPNEEDKKDAFFKLYLATTVQRQTKLPIHIEVQTSVLGTVKVQSEKPPQSLLEIRLKDKIANDSGTLTAVIDGIEHKFRYQALDDVPRGKPTDRVILNNDATAGPKLTGEQLAKALAASKEIRLRNDTFVPGVAPAPAVPNEAIRSQLELLRLQQFNR
jgi:flagellar hook-basal body complex protein FliE